MSPKVRLSRSLKTKQKGTLVEKRYLSTSGSSAPGPLGRSGWNQLSVKYFDLESAIIRRLEAATIDMERWCVRTDAGKKVFEPAAVRAGLGVLHNGDHIRLPEGPCLIIGIATWSDPDMIALDSAVDLPRVVCAHK